MTRPCDYTKLNDARRRSRGEAEALSDAKAQAVIRLVDRQHKASLVPDGARRLARDIVVNYEGDDTSLLGLQAAHAGDPKWLPGKSTTRSVLSTVGAEYESATA